MRTAGVIGRSLTNASLGLTVVISNRDVAKMTSEKAVKKSVSPRLHTLAVANADKVFEAAFVDGTHADTHGRKEVRRTHRLGSAVYDPVSGRFEPVLVTVLEYVKDGTKMYTVEAIDVAKYENSAGQLAAVTVGERQAPIAEFVKSIANRVAEVNGGEAKFAAGREYDEVVARYTNADGSRKQGWMKAPNGKPTNLTERQWVQARTPAFKRWFGDWENDPANASKVVAANGEPLVVWHGSEKRFSEFSNKLIGSHTDANGHDGVGVWGRGHYFSDRNDLAEEYQRGNPDGQTIATFLNIRNPMPKEEALRIANEAWDYTDPDGKNYYREYQRLIDESVRKNDYDGVMAKGKCATEYVAFSPAQIKSATDNAGAFDAGNPDIRFHAGRVNPNLAEDVRTAIAGDADGKPVGRRREVAFSEMPDALKAVGIPDLPIRTRTDIVRKLRRDHGFTERQIVALPEAYGQPAAVFLDGKAYVVLTGMQVATRGGSEKPVMVVLRESVDRNGRHEFLASAYPREESNENLYTGLARSGKMLFLDKNKVAVIGLNGRTISTLNEQADGNRVKTPEDLSSAVSSGSMPNSGGGVNGGEAKFAVGKLYTGSAADYERPSLVHVGTGEGAQVYGWGLYASDRRGVAEHYARMRRDAERRNVLLKGAEIDAALPFRKDVEAALRDHAPGGSPENAAKWLEGRAADLRRRMAEGDGAEEKLRRMIDRAEAAARWIRDNARDLSVEESKSHVYEQTFFTDRAPGDESHLLDWDGMDSLKPGNALHAQIGWIRRQARKEGVRLPRDLGTFGGEVYEAVASALGSPKAASEFLARAGIDGVKYRDETRDGERGWNYVSFRDDNIRVDHKWTDGVARFAAGRGEDALKELRPVETHREARSYAEARTVLAPQVGKTFRNRETGVEATLSNNSVNKLLSGKAVAKSVGVKEHLAAVANVSDLFENGRLLATDEGSRKGVLSAKRFFSRFMYNGEDLVAKTTVLEYERGDHRIYSVEAMEVEKAGSILAPKGSTNQAENPALPSTPRIVPQSGGVAQGGEAKFAAGEAVAMDAVEVVYDPRAQVLPGGVRVAADAGRGERTPGGLASSRELSAQRTTPLSRLGRVNAMALPLSEMVRLYRDLTGSAVPPRVARRLPGGAAATHTRAGALAISADVLGLVDRTDAAKEKARLKEHGFFRDEDADWCATQLPAAVRAERERSDRQLGEQLRLLGERRVRGAEAGGHAAARLRRRRGIDGQNVNMA